MEKIKLLCLPYAGGSAYYLKSLVNDFINKQIEVVPIELPGRGGRFNEELISDCDELAEELMLQINNLTAESEYAFFGYSMGARLIYALYSKIKSLGLKTPKHMFFCASSSPDQSNKIRNTDTKSLIEKLKSLGGTSDEILNDDELLSIIIPVFRADCNIVNSFSFEKYRCLIDCPITIFNGKDDTDAMRNSESWNNMTKDNCNYIEYDGGHFFILNHSSEVCKVISSTLSC